MYHYLAPGKIVFLEDARRVFSTPTGNPDWSKVQARWEDLRINAK